jgi:RNA polymerase sigma factor (sigma-70 family)
VLSQTEQLTQDDEELAGRVTQGDEDAFTELYKRHFPGIYDHAARTMGDRESAADVAQSTFVKALEILRQGRAVQHVKPWLYAIARNKSIDELRYRKRLKPTGEIDDRNDPVFWGTTISLETSDPQTAVIEKEAAQLVWASAAALSAKDYSLLDLHVRRGLTSDELAESLGLRKGAVYTRLSRLKDALEGSVTSAVMLRQGRRDCPELDALLSGMNATQLTREISRSIQEHVRDCDICQESKKRYVTAAEILAGLAPLPATPKIEGLWDDHSKRNGHRPQEAQPKLLSRRGFRTAFRTHRLVATGTVATVATSVVVATVLIASGSTSPIPEDPADVRSVSHEVGRPSDNNIVEMAWTPNPDADAYSVEWSSGGEQLPDATADLGGDADGTTSPPLVAGSWYFNMRTGAGDEWTHTVHVGPFIIEEAADEITSSDPIGGNEPPSRPDKDRRKKEADDDTSPTLALGPPSPPAPSQGETPPDDDSPKDDDAPPDDPPLPPPDDPPPPEEPPLAPPTITSAPAELSNDAQPQWSFTGARGSQFECSLRGAPFEPCASPAGYDVSDLGDGPYLFQVIQEGRSGNRSDPAASVFTLDTLAPPAPKITGRPAQFTSDPNIGFLFEGEPGGLFECFLSNGSTKPPFAPCSSPRIYNLTFEPDGVYTFAVQQADPAGNVSPPTTYSFELGRRGSQ